MAILSLFFLFAAWLPAVCVQLIEFADWGVLPVCSFCLVIYFPSISLSKQKQKKIRGEVLAKDSVVISIPEYLYQGPEATQLREQLQSVRRYSGARMNVGILDRVVVWGPKL